MAGFAGHVSDADRTPNDDDGRLPASLRREHLLEYDLEQYPLPQLVSALLDVDADLQLLHKTKEGLDFLRGTAQCDARAYAARVKDRADADRRLAGHLRRLGRTRDAAAVAARVKIADAELAEMAEGGL